MERTFKLDTQVHRATSHRMTERFRKSYKYKHKPEEAAAMQSNSICKLTCDSSGTHFRPASTHLISLIILIIGSHLINSGAAFCPLKCACNDLELWANCTQVQAIAHVPMTLNPLLKRLTLLRLPLAELSNSLALYRQLEVLELSGNQLRSIKYENFNFKSAPKLINLAPTITSGGQMAGRHFKHQMDKQLGVSEWSNSQLSSSTESIRFHLRHLKLSDNKLEQLGESTELATESTPPSSSVAVQLRSHQLERLAPFLTLGRLELLDLSGNKLTRLQQHVFLGLSRLRQLDLSRNQLEFLDQRAFVGLVELNQLNLASNKLAHQQQQFLTLGRSLCLAPMLELRHLDLSWNWHSNRGSHNKDDEITQQVNILPSQMFACAPRLLELKLRALGLKYIQSGSLEQLVELKSLDLSENLFELVPFQSSAGELEYATSQSSEENNSTDMLMQQTLAELKLSSTPIEFVSLHSFSSRSLARLERLEMRSMPQLVSFDLASLSPARLHLKQLLLDHNLRLQSFHSSQRQLDFPNLQLIDLNNAQELRQLQLDQMLHLASHSAQSSRQATTIQLDISQANNLNCSSCQMAWLIDAFKQRRPLSPAAGHAPLQLAPRPPLQPANGWAPIPFDPYASWPLPVGHQSSTTNQQQQQQQRRRQVNLINSDLINCAWPFSMPLIELINLETNYAPLFGVDTSCAAASLELPVGQIQTITPPPPPPPPPQLPARQPFRQHNHTQHENSQPEVGLLTSSALALAGLLVMGALVVVLFRLRGHLMRKAPGRRRDDVTRANESPTSFTATTSIDSPQSSSTGSNRPPPLLLRNPAPAPPLTNHYYYYVPAGAAASVGVQKPTSYSLQKESTLLRNCMNVPLASNHSDWTTRTTRHGQVDTIVTQSRVRTAAAAAEANNCASTQLVDRNEEIKVRGNLFLRFVERLSAVAARRAAVPLTGIGTHRRPPPPPPSSPPHTFNFGSALAAQATPLRYPQGRGVYSNYTNGLTFASVPAVYMQTGSGSGFAAANDGIIQVDDQTTTNHYSICDDADDHDDDTQLQQTANNNYTNGHRHLNQLQPIRDDYVTSGAAGGAS